MSVFQRKCTNLYGFCWLGLELNLGEPFGKIEVYLKTDLKRKQSIVDISVTGLGRLENSSPLADRWPNKLKVGLINNAKIPVPDCPLPTLPSIQVPAEVVEIEQMVENEIGVQNLKGRGV